jgi:hypothetical protein
MGRKTDNKKLWKVIVCVKDGIPGTQKRMESDPGGS